MKMKRKHPRHYRPFIDNEPYSSLSDGQSWEEFSQDIATFPLDEGISYTGEGDEQKNEFPNDAYKGGFPPIGESEPMYFD